MRLILDTATARQIVRKPSLGASSERFVDILSGSPRSAISGIRLQSLPPAHRERSSADAPAPGPGGFLNGRVSRLEEADREWFNWRFGEDA
jgi:hypothetical protein